MGRTGFTSEEKFISNSKYVLRKIAGENILVSMGEGVADFCGIVKLNLSAEIVWNTLQKGATKEQLIQALVEQFAIGRDQAEQDVESTLELLISRGMISNE